MLLEGTSESDLPWVPYGKGIEGQISRIITEVRGCHQILPRLGAQRTILREI